MLNKQINFVGNIKKYIIISSAIILIGIIASIVFGPVLDIQFKGGTKLTYSYTGEISYSDAENALKSDGAKLTYTFTGELDNAAAESAFKDAFVDNYGSIKTDGQEITLFLKGAVDDDTITSANEKVAAALSTYSVKNDSESTIKFTKDMLGNNFSISGSSDLSGETQKLVVSLNTNVSAETADASAAALGAAFPENNIKSEEINSVEASVGGRFFAKALVAVLIASILVIIYVGLRFRKIGGVSAGITALIALVHDVLISFFICVIFRLQIDANFIAVVLTLLGYSLNNTIIIYDRVRENRRMFGTKLELSEMVNKSNNETMARTVLTTVTTLLAVVVIIIVSEIKGLTALRSFSIPLAAGLISGAYSSICLAPCLWVKWKERAASKVSDKANYAKKKKRA